MRIESDKKKERVVFVATAIGIVVVLIVWGFQLNEMFRDVAAETIPAEFDRTAQDLQDAKDLSDQIKETIPFLQNSLSEIIDSTRQQKAEEATEATLSDIGEILNAELQLQAQPEIIDEQTQNELDTIAEEETEI